MSANSAQQRSEYRFNPPALARGRATVGGPSVSVLDGKRDRDASRSPGELLAKRAIDLIGSGIGLALLSPLLLALALAVCATSAGPVLFRQARYGQRNRLFTIYKFRTMRRECEDRTGVRQTVPGDHRVTRVGAFMRATSLDELPQLWNVLKGEMSLVGPRPHVPGMLACGRLYEDVVPEYFERHRVRPGLTGLAQVAGYRGPTTDYEAAVGRVQRDLDYVRRWSVALDCRLILRTLSGQFLDNADRRIGTGAVKAA